MICTLMRWLLLVAAFVLAPMTLAQAGSITPVNAALSFDEDGATLSAEFSASLGSQLEETLLHGVTLTFKLEFILERPRQYWVSEHIASYDKVYRLSYSSLTRQYRVAHGSLQQSYATLAEAMRTITRVSGLPVVERGVLRSSTSYDAAVRLSLDRSQLPKPLQLDALTSADWQVEATTRRWRLTTP
jgi:hypothetical protein